MSMSPITSSMLTVAKQNKNTIVINYDDPNIKDEECTYTFNKDGSASRVSNAWGTKTEFPKDTFIYNGKETPLEMVNEFNSYSNYKNKLDLQA